MKAKTALRLALIAALLVTLAVAAGADTKVTISSPADGSTVHGLVGIAATKSDPLDGWLSMRILPTNRQYLMAALAPVAYQWNTQERDDTGRLKYRDGQYTIEVVAYDGSGRLQDRGSVQVTLKNAIPNDQLGGKVLLRVNFNRADAFVYRLDATQVVDVPGRAGQLLRNPPQQDASAGMGGGGMGGMGMGGGMGGPAASGAGSTPATEGIPSNVKMKGDATWSTEVLSPSATGRAVVDNDLLRGYYTVSWQWPKKMNADTGVEESNVPDSF